MQPKETPLSLLDLPPRTLKPSKIMPRDAALFILALNETRLAENDLDPFPQPRENNFLNKTYFQTHQSKPIESLTPGPPMQL